MVDSVYRQQRRTKTTPKLNLKKKQFASTYYISHHLQKTWINHTNKITTKAKLSFPKRNAGHCAKRIEKLADLSLVEQKYWVFLFANPITQRKTLGTWRMYKGRQSGSLPDINIPLGKQDRGTTHKYVHPYSFSQSTESIWNNDIADSCLTYNNEITIFLL